MRLKEFLLSEGLDVKAFAAWKQAMKDKGAVTFERVELDNVLAKDEAGRYLGSFDKQRNVAEAIDNSIKPTKVTYVGRDGVSRTFDAIPFDMWTPDEVKIAARLGGVGIRGLSRRQAEHMIASTSRHFLIRDFDDGRGSVFKHYFVPKSWVRSYTSVAEAASPGDEDYDGDPANIDTFWVSGWNEEEGKPWMGKVSKSDGKWVESSAEGAEPHNWGGQRYMSYLTPDDVMGWLRKDYSEVDGPFFDKDEAIEHAEHRYGSLSEAWVDSGAKDANGKWADYRDGKIGAEAMATWLYGSRVHKKTRADKLKSAYGAIAQQENTSKLINKAKGDALRQALKHKYNTED